MAVGESDPQVPMGDDFRKREVRGIDVKIALDDLEVGRGGAQEVVGFFVG